MVIDGIHHSSYGIALDRCCVRCGVWVGVDDENRPTEFDGFPHQCKPRQWRNVPADKESEAEVSAPLF